MRTTPAERSIDRRAKSVGCEGLVLKNEDEIDEVPYGAVRSFTRTRVRVKLLCPVLLGRERRNDHCRNARESQPIFSFDVFEWLEDFVAYAEVNVEPHERTTVEACINWKPRASFRSLIEFGHRFADDEREEVRQLHRRRQLQPFSEILGGFAFAFSPASNGQIEILRGTRLVETHLEGVAAFQYPTIANRL